LKFCPSCGTPLPALNPKFCPECGINLQSHGVAPPPPPPLLLPSDSEQSILPNKDTPQFRESINEEEREQVKFNTYNLGVDLENTTASIFEKMGYSVEKRKRLSTKSGATAEIDILLIRGNRRRAVECKNYDPSRSVPVSDMRIFKDKLYDTGVISGVFVTNTYFSEDAEKCADSVGIELWNGEVHKEKFYAYAIGRIKNPSLINDPILPLNIGFSSASGLSLRNNHSIRLFSSVLLYHPYIIVKSRFQAKRNDPTGKTHIFSDNGTYFVDALDGDIVNLEKDIVGTVLGLFKKKEERLKSKEDKLVSEDLATITPISKPVLSNSDYNVSIAEPQITEAEATKIVKSHVIEKNKKKVSYEAKVRGEVETREFSFVPRVNEVSIRGVKMVYVPKWNFEYETGQSSFSRRILGSSGRTLEDNMAKCRKCALLKMSTIAVCEICGIPLCEKHVYQEGKLLCVDHISDEMRQKIKGKSLFSKFKVKL
jgi:hypothetical protein